MEAPKREDVRRERWPIEDTSKKGKYEAVEKMGKEAQKRGGGVWRIQEEGAGECDGRNVMDGAGGIVIVIPAQTFHLPHVLLPPGTHEVQAKTHCMAITLLCLVQEASRTPAEGGRALSVPSRTDIDVPFC